VWGPRWTSRVAWPTRSLSADWDELIEKATPRERSVFGFPDPGDPYWDEQTLADTQLIGGLADRSTAYTAQRCAVIVLAGARTVGIRAGPAKGGAT